MCALSETIESLAAFTAASPEPASAPTPHLLKPHADGVRIGGPKQISPLLIQDACPEANSEDF